MTPTDQIVASCIFCGYDCPVGAGICHCGCGQPAPVAHQSYFKRGVFRGLPFRCCKGHKVISFSQPEPASPFKIDGVYCRLIPLTQHQYTIVWEQDYWELARHKWHAYWSKQTRSFYALRNAIYEGRRVLLKMHRELLGLSPGDGYLGDHENHLTLDNRRSNIRVANHNQNAMNRRRRADNRSGIPGVSWCELTEKWHVVVTAYGKKSDVGRFSTLEEAREVRNLQVQALHQEFAYFPGCRANDPALELA